MSEALSFAAGEAVPNFVLSVDPPGLTTTVFLRDVQVIRHAEGGVSVYPLVAFTFTSTVGVHSAGSQMTICSLARMDNPTGVPVVVRGAPTSWNTSPLPGKGHKDDFPYIVLAGEPKPDNNGNHVAKIQANAPG